MQNQMPVRLSFTADCLYRKHQSGYNFKKKLRKEVKTDNTSFKQAIYLSS